MAPFIQIMRDKINLVIYARPDSYESAYLLDLVFENRSVAADEILFADSAQCIGVACQLQASTSRPLRYVQAAKLKMLHCSLENINRNFGYIAMGH